MGIMSNALPKKISSLAVVFACVLAGLFIFGYNRAEAACGSTDGVNFTLTTSCTISSADGINNANFTVGSGGTLQINSGGTFNWNSGYSISITGTGQILMAASGATLANGTASHPVGGPPKPWATTTPVPTAGTSDDSVAYNGYLYTSGGDTGAPIQLVYFAPINSTGSIGSWISTTNIPTPRRRHGMVAYNNYVYIIGGDAGVSYGGVTSTIYFAPINSTGSIGTWTTNATALPTRLYAFAAVVYNNYLYTVGGITASGTATSSVFYAPINSTGSIGAWSSTTKMPSIGPGVLNTVAGAAAYNGYLYSGSSTTYFAPINSTGSIGAWSITGGNMPALNLLNRMVANNGYLYSVAGTNGPVTSTIIYAIINANGSLGNWTVATNSLPAVASDFSSAVYNNYMYRIRGSGPGSATSSVVYSSIAQ